MNSYILCNTKETDKKDKFYISNYFWNWRHRKPFNWRILL